MTSSAGSPLVGGGNDGRSRRWDEHREARRTALLGCAVEAIDASGPRLTVETAAACADVSRTIVHRYFADRDGLGDAVAEHLRDAMLEVVDRRLDDPLAPGRPARVVQAPVDDLKHRLAQVFGHGIAKPVAVTEIAVDDRPAHVRARGRRLNGEPRTGLVDRLDGAAEQGGTARFAVLVPAPAAPVISPTDREGTRAARHPDDASTPPT